MFDGCDIYSIRVSWFTPKQVLTCFLYHAICIMTVKCLILYKPAAKMWSTLFLPQSYIFHLTFHFTYFLQYKHKCLTHSTFIQNLPVPVRCNWKLYHKVCIINQLVILCIDLLPTYCKSTNFHCYFMSTIFANDTNSLN